MGARVARVLAIGFVSASLSVAVGAPARADSATYGAMVGYLNDLRGSVGAPRVAADARVAAASQHHADYLSLNGIVGHFETAGAAGYTGYAPRDRLAAQGYSATFVSEVAAWYPGWQTAMTELWAAPYHRLGMMHPHNVVAGWGHSSLSGRESTVGDFVYDFGSAAPDVVRAPAAGQTGVPTSWNGNESPSPLPAGASRPVGYPIVSVYRDARTVALRGASLVRVVDGASLPLYYAPQLYESDYAVVIPQRPLAPATAYRVHLDLTVAGAATSDEWTFSTSVDGTLRLASMHSSWAGQSDPPALAPGDVGTVTVRFTNAGTDVWQKGVAGKQVNLGVENDVTTYAALGMAVGWLAPNRVATTVETAVAPGGVGTFTFQVRAPAQPGTYRMYLRPVVDGVMWLEDQGVYVSVTSVSPYHSAWVDQSAYPTLRANAVSDVLTIRFRNAGTRPWVRGILGQQANLGVVGDDTRWAALGVGWPLANRVATTQEASVDPGALGTFSFQVRAPAQPGVYVIRLRPVIDGTVWMEDQGVYLRVTVVP